MSGALCALSLCGPARARAQTTPSNPTFSSSEEVEPLVIATRGTTTIGLSGALDRFQSTEQRYPLDFTAHVDVTRFLTQHLALLGGVTGSGSIGGDDSASRAAGPGAPALHAFGGALYYFTPRSMVSFYAGPSYWRQLTQRKGADPGDVAGLLGVQAAVSSRAMFFVEGGYGVGLERGSKGEMRTRLIGRIGIRLKF